MKQIFQWFWYRKADYGNIPEEQRPFAWIGLLGFSLICLYVAVDIPCDAYRTHAGGNLLLDDICISIAMAVIGVGTGRIFYNSLFGPGSKPSLSEATRQQLTEALTYCVIGTIFYTLAIVISGAACTGLKYVTQLPWRNFGIDILAALAASMAYAMITWMLVTSAKRRRLRMSTQVVKARFRIASVAAGLCAFYFVAFITLAGHIDRAIADPGYTTLCIVMIVGSILMALPIEKRRIEQFSNIEARDEKSS